MKTKYFLGAALCVCAAFSSCSDDVLEEQNNIPWHEGDGIQFGARAGFENNDKESRTIYTGEFYEVGGKKFEKINWVPNQDFISILSPEATVSGGGDFADYQVTERHPGTPPQQGTQPEAGTTENSNYDYATLVPATQGKALQWGTKEEHHFYACYPTQASTTQPGSDKFGIKMVKEGKKIQVSGTIPNNQIPLRLEYVKGDEKHPYTGFVARPVMRNAHMVAYGTHDKSNPDPVNLTFKSIVTALEIDLVGVSGTGTNIIGALIGTKDPNQKLVGQYQCEINNGLETGYPVCKNITANVTSNQILIPLLFSKQPNYETGKITDLKGPQGVLLKKDQHLKFTAFILPTDDGSSASGLKDITLTLISMTGRQQHLIPIPQDKFKAHLKHYVNNVKIPTQFDSRNWMSRLDDNVYLHQLSIPGTSNSYSHAYTGTDVDYKKSQNLTIAEQWNKGIRCFEIKSDRNLSSFGDLGHRSILAGSGESLNPVGGKVTVRQAIKEIWQQVVDNPSELAVIIMNYQPSGKTRDAGLYLGDFHDFLMIEDKGWEDIGLTPFLNKNVTNGNFSVANNTIKYDPTLTLGECRNKLLFIVRPSSFGEGLLPKDYVNGESEREYLIVDGWGSLQDQWYQRGYDVNVTEEPNAPVRGVNANSAADVFKGSMEQGMIAKSINGPFTYLADTEVNRFDYDTNGVRVWAQDWNRVCAATEVFDISGWILNSFVQWKESYSEKLKDAQETFEKATIQGATKNMLFINSLSGYFIDKAIADSYKPAKNGSSGGSYGNITTYTQKINKDFFVYMWNQWNKRITAPMGIVMMNRVGSGTETSNPENYYLPNIIISNNFSFPLEKAPSTGK